MSVPKSAVNKNLSSLFLSGTESIVAEWKVKTGGVDSQQISLGKRSCRGSVRDADSYLSRVRRGQGQVFLLLILFFSECKDYKSIVVQMFSADSFLNIVAEQKCTGTML